MQRQATGGTNEKFRPLALWQPRFLRFLLAITLILHTILVLTQLSLTLKDQILGILGRAKRPDLHHALRTAGLRGL